MMTLEEKLEVIKAYAEGKPIEVYVKSINQWINKSENRWDFEEGKYRIKPNEATKFKVGDRLVYKSNEGIEGIEVYEVTEATQEYYRLDDKVNKTPEYVEEEFINERDALWCFNIYDYVSKRYSICLYRKTIPEMDEEFGAYHDTLSWKPIYGLGFKLKENTNV
nr:MAG TPA: CarD protein [Caudoviricetes sp.]